MHAISVSVVSLCVNLNTNNFLITLVIIVIHNHAVHSALFPRLLLITTTWWRRWWGRLSSNVIVIVHFLSLIFSMIIRHIMILLLPFISLLRFFSSPIIFVFFATLRHRFPCVSSVCRSFRSSLMYIATSRFKSRHYQMTCYWTIFTCKLHRTGWQQKIVKWDQKYFQSMLWIKVAIPNSPSTLGKQKTEIWDIICFA